MGKILKFEKKDGIDEMLEACYKAQKNYSPASEHYQTIAKNIEILKNVKAKDTIKIDPNVVLGIFGTFAQMWLLMNFERANIVTSKAFGLIGRKLR